MTSLFTKADFSRKALGLRPGDERGLFLPLVAMMLFSIFAVIGLAVDGGNLYQARVDLQSSMDAATRAASKKFAQYAHTNRGTGFEMMVRDDVVRVMKANIIAARGQIPNFPAIDSFDVDVTEETITARAVWPVRLYILGNFPGYTPTVNVTVVSRSLARKLMISLIMDTSLSMVCPSTGNDCSCSKLIPPVCPQPRILHVITAAKDFLDLLNPARDLVDITWYSVSAITDFTMDFSRRGKGFNKADALNHLENISAGYHLQGSTNTCDGVHQSYQGTYPPTLKQHRGNVGRVLFTDGAPAAGRFFFARPKAALPANNVLGLAATSHDYTQWATNWVTFNQYVGSDPTGSRIPSVSRLAKSRVPYAWLRGSPPGIIAGDRYWPAYPAGLDSTVSCSISSKTDPAIAYQQCLEDFSFNTPDGKTWGGTTSFYDYHEQFYHCVIAMSDFARLKGSVIYAISLGANPAISTDPYQNALDDHTRKDCLLARVAYDPEKMNLLCPFADFPGEFSKTRAQQNSARFNVQGNYYYAQTAPQVGALFTSQLYPKLARKLKTSILIP